MQRKINLSKVICLRMGKTTEAKPHRVNLRSPFTRIHYYQSQVVTSIRNLTKPFGLSQNTNLQLNPYPNTQLDLYCSLGYPWVGRVGLLPNPQPTRNSSGGWFSNPQPTRNSNEFIGSGRRQVVVSFG